MTVSIILWTTNDEEPKIFTQNLARIWIISYRTRNTNLLKKDHNILIKQQRIFRLIDEHKHTTEHNQPTKPIKTRIFIAENHQMTLAVETKMTNEDGSIKWTNYTVKDLYPQT